MARRYTGGLVGVDAILYDNCVWVAGISVITLLSERIWGGGAGITYIVQRILAWNLDWTWETDIRSLGVTARVRKEML